MIKRIIPAIIICLVLTGIILFFSSFVLPQEIFPSRAANQRHNSNLAAPKISKSLANESRAVSSLSEFEICHGEALLYKGRSIGYVNSLLEGRYRQRRNIYRDVEDAGVQANLALGPVEFLSYEMGSTGSTGTFIFKNNPDYRYRVALFDKSGDYKISRLQIESDAGVAEAHDGPLIGHRFGIEELDAAEIAPWTQSEELVRVVGELEKLLASDRSREVMTSKIRKELLDTLEVFKKGEGGERFGVAQSRYDSVYRYYLEFGTSNAIGIAPEFLQPDAPFNLNEHAVEALFHAVFHAMRCRGMDRDEIKEDMRVDHIEAMRYAAELFWGLTRDDVMGLGSQDLEHHDANRLGQKIRDNWKIVKGRIPERLAENDWKTLRINLRYSLKNAKRNPEPLLKIFRECDKQTKHGDNELYPVQSRYPILRAVALLAKEEKKALAAFLQKDEEVRQLALVDTVLLSAGVISQDWVARQAKNLEGRSIWEVASEIWNPGGGLGRVEQFIGIAGVELLRQSDAPFRHVEPRYRHDRNGRPVDYSSLYGIGADTPEDRKIREVARFNVQVGGDTAIAVCYRGLVTVKLDGREYLGEGYLIEGFKWGQDTARDIPYYTEGLYNYGSWGDHDRKLVTREEFGVFFSLASQELAKWIEGQDRARRADWKPPVMHFNDGQVGWAPYFKRTRYANDPILGGSLCAFTAHTFFNRQQFEQYLGGEVAEERFMRQCNISHEDEMLYFHHRMDLTDEERGYVRRYVPVCDPSSAGIRCADWVGGVSAEHVYRLRKFGWDNWGEWRDRVKMVAVNNGDLRALTARYYRDTMREVCGANIDVEEPTAREVYDTNMRCKQKLVEELRSREGLEGFDVELNPRLPVISYSGRGVPEKAGRQRALSDKNIKRLVRLGAQIVIGYNPQPDGSIAEELRSLMKWVRQKKAEEPRKYRGNFIFVEDIDINEQRMILAASDIQVQDSDPNTEAAGLTEAHIFAVGGIEVAPPWIEGMLQAGIAMNLDVPGEGNYLSPDINKIKIVVDGKERKITEDDYWKFRRGMYDRSWNEQVGEAYFEVLKTLCTRWGAPEKSLVALSEYQAKSIPLSSVLEELSTVAEYFRQWSDAIGKKDADAASSESQAEAAPRAGNIRNALRAALTTNLVDKTDISVESDMKPQSGFGRTTVFTEARMLKGIGIFVPGARPGTYQARSDIRDLLPPAERKALIREIVEMPEPALAMAEILQDAEKARVAEKINAVIKRHLYAWLRPGAVIADVRKKNNFISEHISWQKKLAEDMKNTVIVIKRGLAENITGRKSDTVTAILSRRYQVMEQDVRQSLSGRDSVMEVETESDMFNAANRILSEGKNRRVIIIDDGSLTGDLSPETIQGRIPEGEPGTDYCLIVAGAARTHDRLGKLEEALPNLHSDNAIPFVNINAMAVMGLAILSRDPSDRILFEMAYMSFTGEKEVPPDLFIGNRIQWLVRALPRITRFDMNKADEQRLLDKLFKESA